MDERATYLPQQNHRVHTQERAPIIPLLQQPTQHLPELWTQNSRGEESSLAPVLFPWILYLIVPYHLVWCVTKTHDNSLYCFGIHCGLPFQGLIQRYPTSPDTGVFIWMLKTSRNSNISRVFLIKLLVLGFSFTLHSSRFPCDFCLHPWFCWFFSKLTFPLLLFSIPVQTSLPLILPIYSHIFLFPPHTYVLSTSLGPYLISLSISHSNLNTSKNIDFKFSVFCAKTYNILGLG